MVVVLAVALVWRCLWVCSDTMRASLLGYGESGGLVWFYWGPMVQHSIA
jgi:hypothetical protein